VNGSCDHNFTTAEKNMMFLSLETREGLQITGKKNPSCYQIVRIALKSFVEMAKFLLSQPGVNFILSERFSQDPLEVFFGEQRAQGGQNDNPIFKEHCVNKSSGNYSY